MEDLRKRFAQVAEMRPSMDSQATTLTSDSTLAYSYTSPTATITSVPLETVQEVDGFQYDPEIKVYESSL